VRVNRVVFAAVDAVVAVAVVADESRYVHCVPPQAVRRDCRMRMVPPLAARFKWWAASRAGRLRELVASWVVRRRRRLEGGEQQRCSNDDAHGTRKAPR
jgi:hypothetical protein